jgi:hypothetical protein
MASTRVAGERLEDLPEGLAPGRGRRVPAAEADPARGARNLLQGVENGQALDRGGNRLGGVHVHLCPRQVPQPVQVPAFQLFPAD